MIGTLIVWALGIAIICVFLGVAWDNLPEGFKRLVKKLLSKLLKKKEEVKKK